MSGGVDSAVAALEAEGEAVAVTLELWRDPENDGERSCCSADAVRSARALAHRMGLAHFTLDLRDEFRAGRRRPVARRPRRRPDPEPVRRCNGHVRLDAMLEFADRLGAATLTTGHYARRTPDGLLRHAADQAKDQTYMLAALAAPRSRACASRSATSEQGRGPRHRARGRAAGREQGRLAGPLLPRRHRPRAVPRPPRRLRERPGDIVDRAGARIGRHRGHHHFTVGQRRGLGIGGEDEPLYVLETDARANTVTVGPRTALQTTTVRLRGVRLHTDAAEVDAVKLRYRAPGGAVPPRRRHPHPGRARPRRRARPGRVPAARGRRRGMRHNRRVTSDEIRETFLSYFEARGHRRLPVGLAGPGDLRSVGPAHDRGHAPAQALLRGHRAAAAQPADELPEVLPLDRHRERRQHRRATSPSSRCSATSRSATTSRRAPSSSRSSCRPRASDFTRKHLDHGLRRRRRARPRPRRGGDRGVARHRRPERADRPARPRGQLLAVRPDRPVRPVQRALPRPRPGVGRRATTARATTPSASSSTGTSCSCSTTRTRSTRSRRCRRRTSTPAWASTAWRSSSRACRRSSRPTSSRR